MRLRRGVVVMTVLAILVGSMYVVAADSVEDRATDVEEQHDSQIQEVETDRVLSAYERTLSGENTEPVSYGPLGVDHPRHPASGRLVTDRVQTVTLRTMESDVVGRSVPVVSHELRYPYRDHRVEHLVAAPLTWSVEGGMNADVEEPRTEHVANVEQHVISDSTVYVATTDRPDGVDRVGNTSIGFDVVETDERITTLENPTSVHIEIDASVPADRIRAAFEPELVENGGRVAEVAVESVGNGQRIDLTLSEGQYRIRTVTYGVTVDSE